MANEQEKETSGDAPGGQSADMGPAQAEAAAEPATLEEAKALLQGEKEKAQRFLANWQRAEADFANYKRRVQQEREETNRLANAALIINILPVLDDLERALASLNVELAGLTWFDGIRLIYRKLQLVLESAGVSQIEAEGQPFDPRFHEAVMYGEGEEGKVVAQVQRGYKLHDRVLRPAMVVVGKGKEEKPPEGEEGTTSK
ncbi:MAG: nucleotide exchange factor GrpE [Dehalococcoidia bacterium]